MENFQKKYRKSLDNMKVPKELLEKTAQAMQSGKRQRRSVVRWSIIVPVCALVLAGSVTAAAYGATGGFTRSYEPRIDENLSSAIMEQAGSLIGQQVSANGLTITVEKTLGDNQSLYATLSIQTDDGSPLTESSAFRKSERSNFASAILSVDGAEVEGSPFRIDDGSQPDRATYECMFQGNFTNWSGKQASLKLEDFQDEVSSCEDAGFLFQNLGELYRGMTPESPENFIRTGKFNIYADKSLDAPSWTIPAGNQKVKFSNQFPNSYIDNIGIHKTGEYGCQRDVLYLSITPGNETEAEQLKSLCFQNLTTNDPVYFENAILTGNGVEHTGFDSEQAYQDAYQKNEQDKLAMNDGRIVIGLDPFFDHSRDYNGTLTVSDLNQYRLVKNHQWETITRFSGEWELSFPLTFQDTTRSFDLQQEIPFKDAVILIKKVTLSDLTFSLEAEVTKGNLELKELPYSQTKLVQKDGTKINVGPKVGGGMDAEQKIDMEGNLTEPVNAEDIVAIELWGGRIELP